MKITNSILKGFSTVSRKIVYHRKLNQLYKNVNKMLLAAGADPIVIAKMTDGTVMKVDLSTRTERVSYYTGKYEPSTFAIIYTLFNPNATFLDIGANIGFYTIPMGNLIKVKNGTGKVISFEPFKGNFERLTENVALNNLGAICKLHNFGLSDRSFKTNITLREDFKNGSNTGNASIAINKSMDKDFKLSPISLEKLDAVWNTNYSNYSAIDFIKMDIEGHEDFCLQGGSQIIAKHRPTILMEVNKAYYKARNVELDTLFLPLIPDNYLIFREVNKKWSKIESLHECIKRDNVFIIPKEKLSLPEFSIFNL